MGHFVLARSELDESEVSSVNPAKLGDETMNPGRFVYAQL